MDKQNSIQKDGLLKDWGLDLQESVGSHGSTSTKLSLALLYENQLQDSLREQVYVDDKVVEAHGGGLRQIDNAVFESLDALDRAGRLATLSHKEYDAIVEFVETTKAPITQEMVKSKSLMESLNEAKESILTEGVVAGDHGEDAMNIAAGKMSGNIVNAGPAVIGMVKRVVPKLIALDFCGIQTMSTPSGQYFGIRSVYGNNDLTDPKQGFDPEGREMFHPELAPDVMHSGLGSAVEFEEIEPGKQLDDGEIYKFDFKFEKPEDREDEKYASLLHLGESGIAYFQVNKDGGLTAPADGDLVEWILAQSLEGTLFETGSAMATSIAELMEGFNKSEDNEWATVTFRVDKSTHEAKERKLKSSVTIEMMQNMKSYLNIDVVSMLQNMIVDEIALEINREIITWVNASAELGKTGRTRTPGSKAGVFDLFDFVDTRNARHNAEAAKTLLYQIDKEANEILRRTGRGRGNVMLASPGVVTLLSSIPQDITTAQSGFAKGANLDFSKSTYAGTFNGIRVHIDQFARYEYFTVGYRGTESIDAGLIFSPYILLTPRIATDPKNFAPVMGYMSRYALSVNPMVNSRVERPKHRVSLGMPSPDVIRKNSYFRHVQVVNI